MERTYDLYYYSFTPSEVGLGEKISMAQTIFLIVWIILPPPSTHFPTIKISGQPSLAGGSLMILYCLILDFPRIPTLEGYTE